jgi:hypothetical protein
METQEIEVTIDRDGNVKLHVRGVKGEACQALTKDLEDALGGEIIEREATAELYESSSVDEQIRASW